MSSTGICVVLPTVGRPTLERTLGSCRPQLEPGDRVLVVADTNQPGLIEHVGELVGGFGAGFEYHELDAGFKHYGCPQRNRGIELSGEGSLVVFQDDTDIFVDDAFQSIRDAYREHGPRPFLFEVDLRDSGCYLDCHREIRCGEVDGHQLVVPNLPGRVAEWPYERYESDFDWIERTLALWPEGLVRVPHLLSVCFEKP